MWELFIFSIWKILSSLKFKNLFWIIFMNGIEAKQLFSIFLFSIFIFLKTWKKFSCNFFTAQKKIIGLLVDIPPYLKWTISAEKKMIKCMLSEGIFNIPPICFLVERRAPSAHFFEASRLPSGSLQLGKITKVLIQSIKKLYASKFLTALSMMLFDLLGICRSVFPSLTQKLSIEGGEWR